MTSAASSGFDDFNRADGPLGPDWTVGSGNFEIRSQQFANVGASNGWALYTVATSLYQNAVVEFDLLDNPSSLAYGAAVIGAGGSDQTFTKVQGSGSYTNVGFYHGVNGGMFGSYGGFFNITPVVGGRVRVYVSNNGDTMNVDIDEQHDGVFEYHYEASNLIGSGLAALLGDGIGLGVYSTVSRADNFSVNGAGPTPILDLLDIRPAQFMTFDIQSLQPDSDVVVLVSTTGPGPTHTPFGDIEVNFPWLQTPAFPADANGVVNFTTTLPANLSGLTLYAHAVEFKADATTVLTNPLAVPIP